MTVLVTGGAGYIGSHTVRALRADGAEVVVLDSLEFGHPEAVLDAPLEIGDIADADLVGGVIDRYGVDAVVHFAGYKAAGESMEMPERYFDNNVARTARLLDTLHSRGVTRVVFSSSCSVYGSPATLPVDEAHPTAPESPYAESKLLVERMLHWFDECHGMRSVSLRYFNAAGASFDTRIGEDAPRPLNRVPLAMLAALGKIAALSVYGTDYPTPDGTCIRDYIHVADLADAHLRAIEATAPDDPRTSDGALVCNLGNGDGFSNRAVIEAASAVIGRDIPITVGPPRPGDPPVLVAAPGRAADVLGWHPARPELHEMIGSAWAWRQSHPGGYAT
jgi:UDP-glucose 4-epimerase